MKEKLSQACPAQLGEDASAKAEAELLYGNSAIIQNETMKTLPPPTPPKTGGELSVEAPLQCLLKRHLIR